MTERDEQRRSGEDLAREGGQRPGAEIGFGEPSTFEPEEDPEQAPETDPDDTQGSSTAMGQAGGALMG